MNTFENKDKREFHEIELEPNYASNESAEDHISEEAHHNDLQQMIPRQSERIMIQKRVTIFGVALIVLSALFICLIYYTFFLMADPYIFFYKDLMVSKCPKSTFKIDYYCLDECPDKLYQRGDVCVNHCSSSDFVFGKYCIITDCVIEEGDEKIKGFFEFSSKRCVNQCSQEQFKLLDRFCFDNVCPKQDIYEIIRQYNQKSQNYDFDEKSNQILTKLKDYALKDLIITSFTKQERICSIDCLNDFNKFVIFNTSEDRIQCSDGCPSDKFIIKKNGQNICQDSCPPQSFISATSNECVESCGVQPSKGNQCILTCLNGQMLQGKECVNKCSYLYPYIYKNQECVKTCQHDKELQYVDNGICSSSCPKFIKIQNNENICTDSPCHLIGSDQKTCVNDCPKNEVQVILNNQLQCLKFFECENSKEYYVPGVGCQPSCPQEYPIILKGMCIQKCFQNWSLFQNTCVQYCPSPFSYSQDGLCVEKCDKNTFQYGYRCERECPSNYYHDYTSQEKICNLTCNGYELQPNRECHSKCPESAPYHYEKICVTSCPTQTSKYKDANDKISCLKGCPPDTFQTPDMNCVKECPENLFILLQMKKCVQTCPNNKHENRICQIRCSPQQRYIDGSDACFEKCPQDYFRYALSTKCTKECAFLKYISKNQAEEKICTESCETIEKFQNGKMCVDQCPKFQVNGICEDRCPLSHPFEEDGQCVSDCSPGKTKHLNKCLPQCPQGFYFIEGINECVNECPHDYFVEEEVKECKKQCEGYALQNQRCVDKCPYYSTQMGKQCWLNSPEYPGPYLKQDGTILQACDFENGYYSNQRFCLKCQGGDNCKKCSQFYGICLECFSGYSLYNNKCQAYCPSGFFSQQGVCIKNDQFLKSNLFFREYNQSRYFRAGQKIKYSILEDVEFIKNQDIEELSESKYIPTVVVHLHDVNSTYLDFYQYPFQQNNSDVVIENLKLHVIEQGISVITVQSPDILYFSNFFKFVLNELLPSLSYFKANVVFSGVGISSNSIVQYINQILSNQQDQQKRIIFGTYIVDMQKGFLQDQFTKDLSQAQFQEIQEIFAYDEDVYNAVPSICKIFTPYIRLNDVVTINRNQKTTENLTKTLSIIGIRNNCQNLHIKPQNTFRDYQKEINSQQRYRLDLPEEEQGSDKKKTAIYQFLSERLLNEVSSWVNNESIKDPNEKLNQLL